MPLRPASASVTGDRNRSTRAKRLGRASKRIAVLWLETLPETVDVAPLAPLPPPPPPPPPHPTPSTATTSAPAPIAENPELLVSFVRITFRPPGEFLQNPGPPRPADRALRVEISVRDAARNWKCSR